MVVLFSSVLFLLCSIFFFFTKYISISHELRVVYTLSYFRSLKRKKDIASQLITASTETREASEKKQNRTEKVGR